MKYLLTIILCLCSIQAIAFNHYFFFSNCGSDGGYANIHDLKPNETTNQLLVRCPDIDDEDKWFCHNGWCTVAIHSIEVVDTKWLRMYADIHGDFKIIIFHKNKKGKWILAEMLHPFLSEDDYNWTKNTWISSRGFSIPFKVMDFVSETK